MSHTPAEGEVRELAALYALGALDEDERHDFERHLAEGCAACAAELRECEETVSRLALAAPPADPPAPLREKLLARVAEKPPARAVAPSEFVGPAEFLVVRREEGEWVESPDHGVFIKLLFVDKERDTVTTLVRLDPGASIPAHRHLGVEQCLVLEGDMRAGHLRLRAGDFNCAMPDSVHEEIHTEHGALLLIVSPESYEVFGRAGDQLPRL